MDLIRGLLWVLLPASIVGSLFLVRQGVPLEHSPLCRSRDGPGIDADHRAGAGRRPGVHQESGDERRRVLRANGAHPYANPTPLTSFVSLLAIAILPAALPITFGHMVGRPRAGWVLLGVMVAVFVAGLAVCDRAEAASPSRLAYLGIQGGNMEGKEVRFGVGDSVLTAVVTSNTATGSYNSMHGSYQPLGVLVPLVNMLLGEVVFGGLGTGLYSIIMVALVGVFIGGLMVGRTPEYLGKTIAATEMKLVAIYTLLMPLVVLPLTGLAVATNAGRAGLVTNSGPRGFTEILFAYASCMANNGQNLAGLDANSVFYNITTAIAMMVGRFGLAVLALTLAGKLAAQGRKAPGLGTLPCDTPMFAAPVLATVLLVARCRFCRRWRWGRLWSTFRCARRAGGVSPLMNRHHPA